MAIVKQFKFAVMAFSNLPNTLDKFVEEQTVLTVGDWEVDHKGIVTITPFDWANTYDADMDQFEHEFRSLIDQLIN